MGGRSSKVAPILESDVFKHITSDSNNVLMRLLYHVTQHSRWVEMTYKDKLTLIRQIFWYETISPKYSEEKNKQEIDNAYFWNFYNTAQRSDPVTTEEIADTFVKNMDSFIKDDSPEWVILRPIFRDYVLYVKNDVLPKDYVDTIKKWLSVAQTTTSTVHDILSYLEKKMATLPEKDTRPILQIFLTLNKSSDIKRQIDRAPQWSTAIPDNAADFSNREGVIKHLDSRQLLNNSDPTWHKIHHLLRAHIGFSRQPDNILIELVNNVITKAKDLGLEYAYVPILDATNTQTFNHIKSGSDNKLMQVLHHIIQNRDWDGLSYPRKLDMMYALINNSFVSPNKSFEENKSAIDRYDGWFYTSDSIDSTNIKLSDSQAEDFVKLIETEHPDIASVDWTILRPIIREYVRYFSLQPDTAVDMVKRWSTQQNQKPLHEVPEILDYLEQKMKVLPIADTRSILRVFIALKPDGDIRQQIDTSPQWSMAMSEASTSDFSNRAGVLKYLDGKRFMEATDPTWHRLHHLLRAHIGFSRQTDKKLQILIDSVEQQSFNFGFNLRWPSQPSVNGGAPGRPTWDCLAISPFTIKILAVFVFVALVVVLVLYLCSQSEMIPSFACYIADRMSQLY